VIKKALSLATPSSEKYLITIIMKFVNTKDDEKLIQKWNKICCNQLNLCKYGN
jgi:hypothetical protein